MRKSLAFFLFLLTLTVLSPTALAYAIEGDWDLTDIAGTPVPGEYGISVRIEDFLFRNTSVKLTISFMGCRDFKYQMEQDQNSLYVEYDTYSVSSVIREQCLFEQILRERQVSGLMKRIFSFQILLDYMFFSDAGGEVLLKFKRKLPTAAFSLTGNWLFRAIQANSSAYPISIDNSTISFCNRKATAPYSLGSKNQIKIQKVENKGCDSAALIAVIPKAKFYVARNSTVDFYDAQDNYLYQIAFVSIQQPVNKPQEQNKTQATPPPTDAAALEKLKADRQSSISAATAPSGASSSLSSSKVSILAPPQGFDIRGNWRINRLLQNEEVSQLVEITETNISFCQRKVVAQYSVNSSNISVSGIQNNGCPNQILISAFKDASYFQVRSNSVGLFDSNGKLLATMDFVMDLQTGRKLQKEQADKIAADEQARQKRIEQLREEERLKILAERADAERQAEIDRLREEERLKILTERADAERQAEIDRLREEERLKILADRAEALRQEDIAKAKAQFESKQQAATQPSIPAPAPVNTIQLAPRLTNTNADLVGKWNISTIFKVPNFFSGFELIFTNDTILLSGCNSHIIPYTINANSPQVFVLGTMRSTNLSCKSDDDGFFLTALVKMHSFQVSILDNQKQAVIKDSNKNTVFEITRPNSQQTVVVDSQTSGPQISPSVASAATRPVLTPTPAPVPAVRVVAPPAPAPAVRVVASPAPPPAAPAISNGRYKILLLKRRDIPLKIASFSDNILQVKLCNLLKLKFDFPKNPQAVTVALLDTISDSTSSNCNKTQQNAYIEYFTKAKSFTLDGTSTILKDAAGEQIISLVAL